MKSAPRIDPGLQKLLKKYESLVWYARKHPSDHPYWETVPEDIRKGALDAVAQVQEHHPEECDHLKGKDGDWQHGFNSGVLAALRWVITSEFEGRRAADKAFPELDT